MLEELGFDPQLENLTVHVTFLLLFIYLFID